MSRSDIVIAEDQRDRQLDQAFQSQSPFYSQPDPLSMVRHYTEEPVRERCIDPEIERAFWPFIGRNIKLGFSEEKDRDIMYAKYQQQRINFIMAKPSYKTAFSKLAEMDSVEADLYTSMGRAIGTNTTRINERTMHATQFMERRSVGGSDGSASGSMSRPSLGGIRGFLAKIGGNI